LSSFADGSDCPTIGPDGECCRCIGQALLLMWVVTGGRFMVWDGQFLS